MKKFELIKYAYDNYPKGTKFTWGKDDIESTGIFHFNDDDVVTSDEFSVFIYGRKEWAEIVKPKIAVKVESEKEFEALMKYYDSLGMKMKSGHNTIDIRYEDYNELSPSILVSNIESVFFPNLAGYKEDLNEIYNPDNYQIIPFSEFAEQKGIKLPLLTSGDGVDLYEGDNFFSVRASNYDIVERALSKNWAGINSSNLVKAFSTKQAALSWIEAQKPKIIRINLYFGLNAHVFNETGEVHIFCKDNLLARLSTGDILDIKSEIK